MVQVVEHLPSKLEALSLNPNVVKIKTGDGHDLASGP
jgi:hypothetical protein